MKNSRILSSPCEERIKYLKNEVFITLFNDFMIYNLKIYAQPNYEFCIMNYEFH